jgi:DNA-binding NarL/FixJ family response regulator
VIVLDISLPCATGLEAAVCVRSQGCDAAIVFLSQHQSAEIVRAAWAVGALGYVAKRDLAAALLPAIRAALRGERFVSPSIDLG